MTIRVAINGMGRIGRLYLRAMLGNTADANGAKANLNVVAFNDIAPAPIIQHLLQFDSTHGAFPGEVSAVQLNRSCFSADYNSEQLGLNGLAIDDQKILALQIDDPSHYPWQELGVDLVIEATGVMRSRSLLQQHIKAGAKKVLLTSPGHDALDADIIIGVNDDTLNPDQALLTCQSCTSNALAVVCQPINQQFGIESGLMTEIHAYTSDQKLLDGAHADLRRARAAGSSMIPTPTAGAETLGRVLPQLAGKIQGYSMRVPTMNVAAIDLTLALTKSASVEQLNLCLQRAAVKSNGVLAINQLPLVSSDFNHHPASAIVDTTLTHSNKNLVKIVAWYDNEWAYVSRLVDMSKLIATMC